MNLDFNEEVIQLSNTGVSPAKVGIMWPGRIVCSGYPLVQKGWYKEHRWKKTMRKPKLVNISMNHRSLWLRILTWSVVSVDTIPQDLKKLNKNKKMVKKWLSPKLAVKRLNHWKNRNRAGAASNTTLEIWTSGTHGTQWTSWNWTWPTISGCVNRAEPILQCIPCLLYEKEAQKWMQRVPHSAGRHCIFVLVVDVLAIRRFYAVK